MNFEQKFNLNFGDRFDYLHLKEVVVKKSENECTITFLYPSTLENISAEDKKEIIDWAQKTLDLGKLKLKVKFMKAFCEEKLIMKALQNYFEKRYKLITTYLSDKSFRVKITPIDVIVEIDISTRLETFFAEHNISNDLAKYLKSNFLVDFVIDLKVDPDFVDEVDITNVEIKTKFKPVQRYNVEIIKEIVGKDIPTKPEYLSFITSPKVAVIVAGYIKKIERKDFVVKKGARAGQTKAFFTFQIADGKGKMECIYFCPKINEKVMESLEECMYVLIQGDVRFNQMNKLCLYVDKIALASEVAKVESEVIQKVQEPQGPVVEIEKLTALAQDTMFGAKDKYNQKIMENTIVVFDIETTGLDPNTDQIIELGAVKIDKGNIIEKFSTFVCPTKEIPYEVVELTGISEDMVVDAPSIDLVIRDFYKFCEGCLLCGHNAIGFDIKFIRREADNIDLAFDQEVIDTMNLARVSRLKISRFNLGTVVKALGLTLEGAHRAWNDAYATAQVLLKLSEV